MHLHEMKGLRRPSKYLMKLQKQIRNINGLVIYSVKSSLWPTN